MVQCQKLTLFQPQTCRGETASLEIKRDMHVIKTRGETHQRMSSDDMSKETLNPNVKSFKTRKTNFIKCQDYQMYQICQVGPSKVWHFTTQC